MISPVLIIKDESTTKLALPFPVFTLDQKWHFFFKPQKKYIRVVPTQKYMAQSPAFPWNQHVTNGSVSK